MLIAVIGLHVTNLSGGQTITATNIGIVAGVDDVVTLPDSTEATVYSVTSDDEVVTSTTLTNGTTASSTVSRKNSTGDQVTLVKTSPLTYSLRGAS